MATVRRIVSWILLIFAEEEVRTEAPHYLPAVAVALLVYGTWELLNIKPLRRRLTRIYSTYGAKNSLVTYLIIFVIGGSVLCLYWWGSNRVFAATWLARLRKPQVVNPANALVTEQGSVITTEPPRTPSPRPPRHVNTMTVLEIHQALEQAGPLERDEVAEQFRHGIVDWELIFNGDIIRHKGTDLMTVRFYPVNSPYPKITCPEIKVEGNAYLGRIRSSTRFRVKGVIGDLDLNWFTLKEATFEQLSDTTPTPTPSREDPKAVPPKQVELKTNAVKSGVPNAEIYSLFSKGDTSLKVSRALEPYVGTVMTIDGKLVQVHGGSGGGPVVLTMYVNNGPGAICVFDGKWVEQLDALKRDQQINVRGKIRPDPAGNDLQLIECELLESVVPSPTEEAVNPTPPELHPRAIKTVPPIKDPNAAAPSGSIAGPDLHELYLTDFKGMKLSTDRPFTSADGKVTFTINTQINLDYESKSKFLSIYIPIGVPFLFQMCASLPELYQKFLADLDGITTSLQTPGDPTISSSKDMVFTGAIYVYYEGHLTLEELGSLERIFRAKKLSPHFRGSVYATAMWLAKKASNPKQLS